MNSDDPLTAIDRLAESFVDMAGASAFDTDLESSDEALTELLSTTFATPVSSGHGSDDLDSLSASSAGDPSQVKGEHIVRQPTRPLIRTPAAEATHTASPSLAPPLEPTPPPPSPAAYLITLASYGVQLVPTGPKHAAALPEVYDRQVTTVAESLSSPRPESATRALSSNPGRYGGHQDLGPAMALAHAHCLLHDLFAADARVAPDTTYAALVSRFLAAITTGPAVVSLLTDPDPHVKELLGLRNLIPLGGRGVDNGASPFTLGLRTTSIQVTQREDTKPLEGLHLVPVMKSRESLTDGWFPWIIIEANGLDGSFADARVRLFSSMRFALGMYSLLHSTAERSNRVQCRPRCNLSGTVYGLQTCGGYWQLYAMLEEDGNFPVSVIWSGQVTEPRSMVLAMAFLRSIAARGYDRMQLIRNWLTCACGQPPQSVILAPQPRRVSSELLNKDAVSQQAHLSPGLVSDKARTQPPTRMVTPYEIWRPRPGAAEFKPQSWTIGADNKLENKANGLPARPISKMDDRASVKSGHVPVKVADKAMEKATDKATASDTDKTTDKATDKKTNNTSDKSMSKPAAKPSEEYPYQYSWPAEDPIRDPVPSYIRNNVDSHPPHNPPQLRNPPFQFGNGGSFHPFGNFGPSFGAPNGPQLPLGANGPQSSRFLPSNGPKSPYFPPFLDYNRHGPEYRPERMPAPPSRPPAPPGFEHAGGNFGAIGSNLPHSFTSDPFRDPRFVGLNGQPGQQPGQKQAGYTLAPLINPQPGSQPTPLATFPTNTNGATGVAVRTGGTTSIPQQGHKSGLQDTKSFLNEFWKPAQNCAIPVVTPAKKRKGE